MNFPAGSKVPLFLEALEDRIAPAAVILSQGGNLLSAGDEGYLSLGNEPSTSALLVKVTAGKALVFWDAQDKLIKGVSVTEGRAARSPTAITTPQTDWMAGSCSHHRFPRSTSGRSSIRAA